MVSLRAALSNRKVDEMSNQNSSPSSIWVVLLVTAVSWVLSSLLVGCKEECADDHQKTANACEEIRVVLVDKLNACVENGQLDGIQVLQCDELCDYIGIMGGLDGCMADSFTQGLIEEIESVDENQPGECQQLNDHTLVEIAQDYDWCG